MPLTKEEILYWLKEDSPEKLQKLWERADKIRRETVGDEVHLRGLVEIGNYCRRMCRYCGLSAANSKLARYRMSGDEIFVCAEKIASAGLGTIVMQSGEDLKFDAQRVAEIIKKIKSRFNLAITLSLGERHLEELQLWKDAGADRYLLRFETSDRNLYDKIHPPLIGEKSDRIKLLRELKKIGYQIGGGVMVGTDGQNFESLADDILLFAELDLDMLGVGPYIPNSDADMGAGRLNLRLAQSAQVPSTALMAHKVIALARIACPQANIPATTALGCIDEENAQILALQRGANVVMPNFTPEKYRKLYQIYPGKRAVFDGRKIEEIKKQLESIGRKIGSGRGDRKR